MKKNIRRMFTGSLIALAMIVLPHVVHELNEKYGQQIGFCGNNDVMTWEGGDKNKIRNEILHKLHAAKGGGFIFQSDHSVSSSVSGETYDYIIKLVREYGDYPLDKLSELL